MSYKSAEICYPVSLPPNTISVPVSGMYLHARTFFTLADTTSIPMGVTYLHARMFCALACMSSVPMGAMSEVETRFEP